jgi:hypothetical protein
MNPARHPERDAEIRRLHEAGVGTPTLARKFGLSRTRIRVIVGTLVQQGEILVPPPQDPHCDRLIAKCDKWAADLERHIQRWGLVLEPSASIEETLDTMERIERRVAEVRAALQEKMS